MPKTCGLGGAHTVGIARAFALTFTFGLFRLTGLLSKEGDMGGSMGVLLGSMQLFSIAGKIPCSLLQVVLSCRRI